MAAASLVIRMRRRRGRFASTTSSTSPSAQSTFLWISCKSINWKESLNCSLLQIETFWLWIFSVNGVVIKKGEVESEEVTNPVKWREGGVKCGFRDNIADKDINK